MRSRFTVSLPAGPNADVVPSNMKASALLFVKQHVEPLVNQVGGMLRRWASWVSRHGAGSRQPAARRHRRSPRLPALALLLPLHSPVRRRRRRRCCHTMQGEYVLVFTSPQAGTARLPSMWIMGAYRSLPRPFRKHVQHIVLVRPSGARRWLADGG